MLMRMEREEEIKKTNKITDVLFSSSSFHPFVREEALITPGLAGIFCALGRHGSPNC